MRGSVAELPTPYNLSEMLPGVLQEDAFIVRFTAGFDAVLAPMISVLDCLDAYFDPLLAPDDFVEWLAGWVGLDVDAHWTDQHRRQSVLTAIAMHRARGTTAGLRAQLSMAVDAEIEVVESGGISRASTPTAEDDEAAPHLQIRVLADDPGDVRLAVLEEVVDAVKPAHVPHTIEVVAR